MIPILLISLGLVALVASKGRASSSRYVPDLPPSLWVQQWRPIVTRLATPLEMPVEYLLAWIQVESGGNPCSIGVTQNPPQEYGLFQLNYPYDEKYATRQALRAACNNTAEKPGIPPNTAAGKLAWANYRRALESQTRALTEAEKELHVKSGIALVQHCMEFAQAQMSKARVNWATQDRYKLAKLVHGLPTLVALLPVATKKLGYPPRSYQEFRQVVEKMTDAEINTNHKIAHRRPRFARTFDIAEQVGRKAA